MSNPTNTRRDFLTATGLLGMSLTAGCSTPSSSDENSSLPAPSPPTNNLKRQGWEKAGERSGQVFKKNFLGGLITVAAEQRTVLYQHRELRNTVRQRTMGNVDTTLRTFFATRVELDPGIDDLPLGVGLAEIMDETKSNAKNSFEAQLKNAGLSNILEVGEDELQTDTGESADLVFYSANFNYGAIEIPVPEVENMIIPAGDLDITGELAVWHHDDYILISGGAYPAEDFEESVSQEITEAITVSVNIDLGLRPVQYREDLHQWIKAVQ